MECQTNARGLQTTDICLQVIEGQGLKRFGGFIEGSPADVKPFRFERVSGRFGRVYQVRCRDAMQKIQRIIFVFILMQWIFPDVIFDSYQFFPVSDGMIMKSVLPNRIIKSGFSCFRCNAFLQKSMSIYTPRFFCRA